MFPHVFPTYGFLAVGKCCNTTFVSFYFQFFVMATDGGTPPRQTPSALRARVIINMIRNLNDPIFQNIDQYSITIPYNEPGGVISNVIEATDADTYPLYSQVEYSIVGWEQDYLTLFSVDRSNGALRLNAGLSDPQSQYNLLIKANDGGTPSRSSEVTFRVYINFNLNPPVINTQTCVSDILETSDTFVFPIVASDQDSIIAGGQWATLIYSLTGNSPDAEQYFYMDDNRILLRRSLENSGQDQYNLTVSVVDGGGLPAATTLFCPFNVIRNNVRPNITNPYAIRDLEQYVGHGTVIFTVTAEDQDPVVKIFL